MTPEAADVIVRARDVIEAQNNEIARLKRQNDVLAQGASFLKTYVKAVTAHNLKCDTECNDGYSCGYEGFLARTGRRCSDCPVRHKVDVMPAKGTA